MSTQAPPAADPSPAGLRGWQVRIFSLLWLAYASYYLCRLNFAVAQPAILREFPTWTQGQIGWIPSVYSLVYAVGQFVNGQLAARLGARRMMTAALLLAGLANLGFSQASTYPAMLLLWGLNGWAQSAGWSLVVETMAAWTPVSRRGMVIGLISTCYQLGNVFAWLLAGTLSEHYGWRAAFYTPGAFMLPMAIVFGALLRNRPEDAGYPPVREDQAPPAKASASAAPSDDAPVTAPPVLSAGAVLRETLGNRTLWTLSIAFFCANSVRYAFMNWSVQYMNVYQGQPLSGSAFKAVALPLIGAAGAVSAGWASDALFGGRRAPLASLMLFGLVGVCLAFAAVPSGHAQLAMALLGLAGFLIFGPDMLMSGAATVDFSHPRAAAAATGLTMSAGALGAVLSGAGVGYLLDLTHGNWPLAFEALGAMALVPALLMATLWNARPKGRKA